jgi:competence protein CoiA
MLSALNEQEETLMAWEATREDGPFFCPVCEEEVILKKGSLVIHHFAHYPEASCSYGTGESEQHRQAKYEIYEALRVHPSVSYLKVERYLKEVRPDVSFLWQGKWRVAIEMQISAIFPDEIAYRTRCYANKNIWVLWTIPYHNTISGFVPYNTRVWERYLHALYFGRVYYWLGGARLLPVHFEPYAQDNRLEEYYDEGEQKVKLRVKHTYSPVLRNVDLGEPVAITDLQPVTRRAIRLGKFDLPSAQLWSISGYQGKSSQDSLLTSASETEGGQ